jgi:hypothetical protein
VRISRLIVSTEHVIWRQSGASGPRSACVQFQLQVLQIVAVNLTSSFNSDLPIAFFAVRDACLLLSTLSAGGDKPTLNSLARSRFHMRHSNSLLTLSNALKNFELRLLFLKHWACDELRIMSQNLRSMCPKTCSDFFGRTQEARVRSLFF